MRILIVGQGIAGTLLGWEFERAGIDFEIVDAGHAQAASRVAAGIINPITGQRLVKSWRVEALLPMAWACYREMEAALGCPLVRRMRIWRHFADEAERSTFAAKFARGDLAPFATSDATIYDGTEGFWIEPALQVDMPTLIAAARRRWLSQGRFSERRVDLAKEGEQRELVVDCAGAAAGVVGALRLDRVKGELLTLALKHADSPIGSRSQAQGPAPVVADVIRNRGHWLLPLANADAAAGVDEVMVGATYDRLATDLAPSPANRAALERSARGFLRDTSFEVSAHLAGWRVNAADRRPVVGRVRGDSRIGYINGLGSKGALYAPWLARQWMNHVTEGVPFDPEVDGARFYTSSRCSGSASTS